MMYLTPLSNTQNTLQIPGYGLCVSTSFKLESKDLSGQGTSSKRAAEGIKPQTLACSVLIPFRQKTDLTRLIKWAQAVDPGNSPQIYQISNETAEACQINQVCFDDSFSINEQESQRAWKISFNLVEYRSKAEKIAERRKQTLQSGLTSKQLEQQAAAANAALKKAQAKEVQASASSTASSAQTLQSLINGAS